MKKVIRCGVTALAASILGLAAQQPQGQTGRSGQAAPAAQPSPEQQAVNDLFAAYRSGDGDAIIKAAENLVTNFPKSPQCEMALTFEGDAYQQQKKDPVKAQLTYMRVLDIDPRSIVANMRLGELIFQQTNEKAFDFADKMASAEKYLKTTMDLLNGPKPNPQMTDQQWQASQQSALAEVHNDLGLVALLRKSYDAAVNEFKQATTLSTEPAYLARLAHALQVNGKNDESIAVCDKLLADPQLDKTIKDLVTKVRANAVQAGGKPAAPAPK
jgi:tetratricopeptide (TPR) repeat protein